MLVRREVLYKNTLISKVLKNMDTQVAFAKDVVGKEKLKKHMRQLNIQHFHILKFRMMNIFLQELRERNLLKPIDNLDHLIPDND